MNPNIFPEGPLLALITSRPLDWITDYSSVSIGIIGLFCTIFQFDIPAQCNVITEISACMRSDDVCL